MSHYIIIRGPAGVGKTTIAKELAKELGGIRISYDDVMKKQKLDTVQGKGIPERNFLMANQLVIPIAKRALANRIIVVFDGCFYWKKQITHLQKNLDFPHTIFSLQATHDECLRRNKQRKRFLPTKGVHEVYALTSKVKIGIPIMTTNKRMVEVVKEIRNHLNGTA